MVIEGQARKVASEVEVQHLLAKALKFLQVGEFLTATFTITPFHSN